MKNHIIPAIKLTGVLIVFLAVIYPFLVWGIAQLGPNSGKGEIVEYKGAVYYSNIGQVFSEAHYFWSRPSAVNYDAVGSGASNKGPYNQFYLEEVQTRINTFLRLNPEIDKSEIPVDLITASGSGLDPNISVQAAKIQVKRIAKSRAINEAKLYELIDAQTEKPLFGLFGPEKINVLELNIALNESTSKSNQ
ncbi:K(+)-transporting ATPase subunit C [Myroides guanonis]|uniref:Potassium-transporting ATPase KdpC subunit n=1 Tax=Myroides guanonis TaxID=1150112 RepID=A0A1I3UPZ9_9FLAO|nr:K(+)-transporting ATPase subunit C [Myroides guanonis]SFJ85052.1 K+-transporting ATPase ATPase C chain [Myroides guanonis]